MTVLPFIRPATPQPAVETIDASALAWIPLSQLRELLWSWNAQPGVDPTFFRRVVHVAATTLAETTDSDAQARTRGWRDAEACRERGRDMLAVLGVEDPAVSS